MSATERNAWASLPQSVRDAVRIPVLERDGYRCQIRGKKCTVVANDVDHIIPLAFGGALLDRSNLRAACAACNRGRRTKRVRPRTVAAVPPSREW